MTEYIKTSEAKKAIQELDDIIKAQKQMLQIQYDKNDTLQYTVSRLEADCKRKDEARENANEKAHEWEGRCNMLENEKSYLENELDKAVSFIKYLDNNYSSYLTEDERFAYWRGVKGVE